MAGPVLEHQLDGLADEARPGRLLTDSVERAEDVVVSTLESTPKNATQWSRAKMDERSGLSGSTIGKVWHGPSRSEFKPDREGGFKL